MDLHPVAVTLARVTYLLAIDRERLTHPDRGPVFIPVYFIQNSAFQMACWPMLRLSMNWLKTWLKELPVSGSDQRIFRTAVTMSSCADHAHDPCANLFALGLSRAVCRAWILTVRALMRVVFSAICSSRSRHSSRIKSGKLLFGASRISSIRLIW